MTSTDFSSLPPEPPVARLALPLFALTLGGLFLAGRYSMAPSGLTAITAVLGLGYLPGLAVSLLVDRRFGLWAGWVLPLILSPLLVASTCLVLTYFDVSIAAASSWIVVGAVATICLTPPPQRELEDRALTVDLPGFPHHRTDRGQVLLLAGIVLTILAVLFLGETSVLKGNEAVFQTALVEASLSHLPPHDPLLAGIPYRGAWAWPLYLAVLSQATGLHPTFLMAITSLVAAFTLVFVCYRCLCALRLDHSRSLWGTIFLFFALATPAWHWLRPEPADAFFLGTFLVPGGHWLAWVYSLLSLWGSTAFLRGSFRGLLWAFLAFVGLWLFHPPLAALFSLVTLAAIPTGWLACRIRPLSKSGVSLLVVGAMGWTACFTVYPYLKSVAALGPFPVQGFFDFSLRQYAHGISSLHWELVLGLVGLTLFLAAPAMVRQLWAIWGALILFLGLSTTFGPPGVEYAGHLLLAPTVGSLLPLTWSRFPRGRPVAASLVILLFVIANGMGLAGYLKSSVDATNTTLVHWIQEQTPRNAVFITLDSMSVLRAKRGVFYDHEHVLRRGHNVFEVTRRATTQFAVLSGAQVGVPQIQAIEAIDAPVYWIDNEPVANPKIPWHLQTTVNGTAVYLWDPPAP